MREIDDANRRGRRHGASRERSAPHDAPRCSRRAFGAAAVGAAAAFATPPSLARAQTALSPDFMTTRTPHTVTIAAGGPGETSLEIAHDLATVLHCVDGLRIVPMVGRGDARNVADLLFLEGVDMAIVRADVLDHLEAGRAYTDDLKSHLSYLAPLFEQEVHLLADERIESVADLEGKFVNVGGPGTLALEARKALRASGVTAIESKFDHGLALERLIEGAIDAMFVTGGKPLSLLEGLRDVTGLHLVPIAPLDGVYRAGAFTHDDYPTLVRAGETVETVSVPSVLAVYDWREGDRSFEKTRIFTEALFRRVAFLRRPARHPKWGDADLSEEIAGWRRFGPAAALAEAERARVAGRGVARAAPSEEELERLFQTQLDDFGIIPRDAEERAQLFAAFKRRLEALRR